MTTFREVQKFRQPFLIAVVLATAALPVLAMWRQFGAGDAASPESVSAGLLALYAAGGALFLLWFLSLRLVTEVRPDALYLQFKWLWPTKRIPYSEIASAEPVQYRPLFDYGGWGVRWGWRGRAFNVSGKRGVDVTYRDGGRLLIGSQQPERLAEAIRERLPARA